MTPVRRALVLGGGGIVGTAWMAGLAAGLRQRGIDLSSADVIVGTSAGAIIGAVLATGGDVDRFRVLPAGPGLPHPERFVQVRAILGNPDLDDHTARRALGRLALESPTISEETHVAQIGHLIGETRWPERDLRITAIDAQTGELRIWRREDDVSLAAAVAASSAIPGVFPPITLQQRRYIDGGLRAGADAQLAEGADVLVVVDPVGNQFDGETTTIKWALITPDAPTLRLFDDRDPDQPRDFPRLWAAAFRAGTQRADSTALTLGDLWNYTSEGRARLSPRSAS